MASSNSSNGGGVGLAGMFALLFTGLKLGHVIDWSWWWVLAPIWGTLVLAFFIGCIVGVVALVKK